MRILLRTGHRAIGLFDPDLGREAEFQRPHRVIDDVRAHVAERDGAVVDEPAPLAGRDLPAVGSIGGRSAAATQLLRSRPRAAVWRD